MAHGNHCIFKFERDSILFLPFPCEKIGTDNYTAYGPGGIMGLE